jgi:hypothetical protein
MLAGNPHVVHAAKASRKGCDSIPSQLPTYWNGSTFVGTKN